MKKFLILSSLVPALAWGQAEFSHFDRLRLDAAMAADRRLPSAVHDADTAARDSVSFFVRVDGDGAASGVCMAGADVELRLGDILLVSAPVDMAGAIAATEGVVSVSLPSEVYPLVWESPYGDDLSRQALGLDMVRSGAAPLPQTYTGKGVVLGLVDIGIDVHHVNFLNPDGTHRVKRAWKHVQQGKAQLTLTADTEEKVAKFVTDNVYATHGTHVMGIAAGSFYDAAGDGPDFRGAAPGADIAVSCGVSDNTHLIKGVNSIVEYARSEGRPCVINISMGSNSGPHDGTDEFPAALQSLASDPAVSVFVSAGNEGADAAFLEHTFAGGEPLRTIINPSDYTAAVWPSFAIFPQAVGQIEIWGDDDSPFRVFADVLNFTDRGPEVVSSYEIVSGDANYLCSPGMAPSGVKVYTDDDAAFNSVYRGFFGGQLSVYPANNRFRAEVSFQYECDNQEGFVRSRVALRVEGEDGHRVYVYGQPMSSVFPFCFIGGFEGYTASRGEGSVNTMAGAPDVVSVGSFVSHNMTVADDELFTTADYTSWGSTPDGRVHPMLSTPGSRIISSMSSDYFYGEGYDEDQISFYSYTDADGTTYHWTPMSGTSMASPFMTGVAATWLEADPTLTTADIVRIARETANAPASPRVNDGAGALVDAYAGLCKVLGLAGLGNVRSDIDMPWTLESSGNVFTVSVPGALPLSCALCSLQGVTVASASSAGAGSVSVDASGCAPGVYVLSVSTPAGVSARKVFVRF